MRKGEVIRPEAERRKLHREVLNSDYLQMKARADQLRESAADSKAIELIDYKTTAAELRLEAFDHERDITGAWKGDFFGRDLNALRDELEDGKGGLDKGKAERVHVLQVNMGELERLNKQGGHNLGDKGLSQTCDMLYVTAESVISKELDLEGDEARSKFEIYRSGGNDFSIILKDADQSLASKIETAIGKWIKVDGMPEGETLPLSVSSFNLGDSADIWQEVEGAVAVKDKSRLFVELVKEQSQICNDVQKNDLRIERFLEMGEKKTEEEAKKFYDEYLKKSLGRLFQADPNNRPLEYEAFKESLESMGEKSLESAIAVALHDYKERNKTKLDVVAKVSKYVLKREMTKRLTSYDKDPSVDFSAPGKRSVSQEYEVVQKPEVFMEKYPATSGEKVLASLEREVERLKILSDGNPEDEVIKARLEVAQARHHAESVKRDKSTGLYERGVFFRTGEQALAEGKPLSIIAIDMAFLKYFDREGGRKTGNAAIKVAARILDSVMAQLPADLHAEAYRVGGDEFALSIRSEDQELLEEIKYRISDEANEAVIPPLDDGRTARYRSENINFNFGFSSVKNMQAFGNEMEAEGFVFKYPKGSAEYTKELMDLAVRVADRESELEKTIHRFTFLIDREYTKVTDNLACLEDYSTKAIGGEEGLRLIRAKAEQIKAEVAAGGRIKEVSARIHREITQLVIEKGLIEIEQQIKNGEYVDKLMEMTTRKIFLTRKIDFLEKELKWKQREIEQQQQENAELLKQKNQLEDEKAQIIELRKRVDKAA